MYNLSTRSHSKVESGLVLENELRLVTFIVRYLNVRVFKLSLFIFILVFFC